MKVIDAVEKHMYGKTFGRKTTKERYRKMYNKLIIRLKFTNTKIGDDLSVRMTAYIFEDNSFSVINSQIIDDVLTAYTFVCPEFKL